MKYGQISKFMSSMGLLLLTAGYVSAELHPYRSEITRSDLQGERHVLGIASPDTIRAVQSGAGITQNVFTSVASYGTGFEPVEGFSPGYIGGQSGWTSFLTSMIEAHVDVSTPATGVQHLQVAKDPFLPVGYFVGGFSPYLGPQPSDPTTVSVEINISALNNGADYYVTPQAPTQGLKTAEVVFEWTGDIKVLDFVGGMWLYYDTLHDWVPGAYKKLEIDIDPGANTIDYYYDGSLIYTSAGGVWGATSVEEVVLYSDNWNNFDVGNFDNLLISPAGDNELTLETAGTCNTGSQVQVTLWARDLTQNVTGYQAFLTYDTGVLSFNAADSQYVDDIFSQHITAMINAEPVPGSLLLDGSVPLEDPPNPGTDDDSRLAVLVFDILNDCDVTSVDFDNSGHFLSELSYRGDPLTTATINTSSLTIDRLPPVVTCDPDITVNADAGLCTAVVSINPPAATDACTAVDPTMFYERSDDPQALLSDPFPTGTTTITWYVFDTCGNMATCDQTVTVNGVNDVVNLQIELAGVSQETIRCLRFVTEDCSAYADVSVPFTDHDGDPMTPVRFTGTVEIPCGTWTTLCVKDEQHTLWSSTTLSIAGTQYVAGSPVTLYSGDTDNDSDVDINDVTWLLAQFGSLNAPGGCPWNGTRDADFSNNGAVGAEDYVFIADNWLTSSTCPCMLNEENGGSMVYPRSVIPVTQLPQDIVSRVDLNNDGLVDYEDVELFELKHNLPGTLSARMQKTTRHTDIVSGKDRKGEISSD